MTNNLKEPLPKKINLISLLIVRLTLGIGFFFHGFGKLPLPPEKLSSWFENIGIFAPEITATLVAVGEIVAGIGIILGGFLPGKTGNFITKASALLIFVIMIGAFYLAHADWFNYEELFKELFMSEQIYIFVLSLFFLINGNKN